MKFDVVIGNPPYQDETIGDNATYAPPIYHEFMDEAYQLAPKVCMITPGRFLFNAGSTPKKWNKKMLEDNHLTVKYYETVSANIFPSTDIKGGVVVTYRDEEIDYGAMNIFTPHDKLNQIIKKVKNNKKFNPITQIIFTQNKFDLDSLYKDYPEYKEIVGSNGKEKRLRKFVFDRFPVFTETEPEEESYRIYGRLNNKRVYRYIPKKYIENHENIEKFKVFVPTSNGSGAIGEVLSTPLIGEPLIGFTGTFISFGAFNSKNEAKNMLKYIKSKFCRVMLGVLKITQDNTKSKWKYVPMQDFTEQSDINWTQSIENIDKQLYKKYNLNQEEIDFIEEKVQAMD